MSNYKDFIATTNINSELREIIPLLNTLTNEPNKNDNLSVEEIVEIFENDPRIKRISATTDILEVYTNPVILDLDECTVKSRIRESVQERHKKLNFGEYLILVKPGYIPCAIPYDMSAYNIPPMYRRYQDYSFDRDYFDRGFDSYTESDRPKALGINVYDWLKSDVGERLGCYELTDEQCNEIDENNNSYVVYNTIIPHPHVNQSCHICYGNIRSMVLDAVEIKSIPFIVNLTLDVLFSYNDENPYYYLWRQRACSGCSDRYTSVCKTCECGNCSHSEEGKCIGCESFRSPSLYGLYKVRRSILDVYLRDARISRKEKIENFKEEIDKFIEEQKDENPFMDADEINDIMQNLRSGSIDRILEDNYDYGI